MSDFQLERRVAESLARQAGKRIARGRHKEVTVSMKGHNNPVTNVDVDVEEFLTAELGAMFPDDSVVGEELHPEEAGPMEEAGARAWVIDPIDGTLNFSRDVPMFCVSIALQVEGESMVGAIYDPMRDELFSAAAGGRMRLDGAPVTVSEQTELADAVLVTGFPHSFSAESPGSDQDNLSNFARLTRASRGVRRLGSAALDLAYVAAGRLDGFWEYFLNPWDTAAGDLMVREAGGRVTDVHGDDYHARRPSIVATNGDLHASILSNLEALE